MISYSDQLIKEVSVVNEKNLQELKLFDPHIYTYLTVIRSTSASSVCELCDSTEQII